MAAPYEERAEEVTFLLEQCGLARYVPAFKNDDVDDSCLGTLTPEDLVDLGLPMGPRVRLARDIRESDDKVSDVRRIFAVRTLQVEMERILSQLEEEAADAPSLAFRADELELLGGASHEQAWMRLTSCDENFAYAADESSRMC